ncbi:MAG: hypothetical protein ACYDEV_04960 [Acidiferrobacter sp.]
MPPPHARDSVCAPGHQPSAVAGICERLTFKLLFDRRYQNVTAVALANKNVRMVWGGARLTRREAMRFWWLDGKNAKHTITGGEFMRKVLVLAPLCSVRLGPDA